MAMQETFTMTRDNLFAANQIMPVVSDKLTIAKAGVLKRGTLLTAGGAKVSATTTQGESPTTTYDDVYAVLAEDVDTTDNAKDAAVYLTGEFNKNALIFGGSGTTIENFRASARKVGIFFKESY